MQHCSKDGNIQTYPQLDLIFVEPSFGWRKRGNFWVSQGYLRSPQNMLAICNDFPRFRSAHLSVSKVPQNIEDDEIAFLVFQRILVVAGGCRRIHVIILNNHVD